jgi:hypothetical protein|tara:strand:+ start:252 stop:458 length:207 start_codon:yes stop_codon:yes gene_type:complete
MEEEKLEKTLAQKEMMDCIYKVMAEVQAIQNHLGVEPVWKQRKDKFAQHMMGFLYEKPTGNPNWKRKA